MKKLIGLIILIMFCAGNSAICEELPTPGHGGIITPQDNPIYYKYLDDYAKCLKKAFESKKVGLVHWGTAYNYTVLPDGTITNLKVDIPQNDLFDKKIKKIILNNPPPPFKEGMNNKEMKYSVYFGIEDYAEYKIKYYPRDNDFWINIVKKAKLF